MIQKLEVTYIPASELEHANFVRNYLLLYCSTLNLHHSDLGKTYMKLNKT